MRSSDLSVEDRFRRFLLLVAGGLFIATPVELLLAEHTGDWIQWIPFVLCAVGLVAVAAALRAPGRRSFLALRGSAIAISIGAAYGVYAHLANNLEFELEIRPNAGWTDVIGDALLGASPLLAPGILVLGALLAAASTFWQSELEPPG